MWSIYVDFFQTFFASTVIIQETFIFCMYNQYINVYLWGMGHVITDNIWFWKKNQVTWSSYDVTEFALSGNIPVLPQFPHHLICWTAMPMGSYLNTFEVFLTYSQGCFLRKNYFFFQNLHFNFFLDVVHLHGITHLSVFITQLATLLQFVVFTILVFQIPPNIE